MLGHQLQLEMRLLRQSSNSNLVQRKRSCFGQIRKHTLGQPLTTGAAFIYANREDLEKEPKYILERHAQLSESTDAVAEEDAPAEPPAEADDAEAAEIAGGEE